MKLVVLFAASAVVLAGCTASSEQAPTPQPSASASEATPAAGGGEVSPGLSTAEQLAADPETPSSIVTWGDNESPFVLVQCESQGSGSLVASGDDVAGGTLLTISVSDGKGELFITEDATLETTLDSTVDTFTIDGTAFSGSGTYQTKSGDQRQMTFKGDCKDL